MAELRCIKAQGGRLKVIHLMSSAGISGGEVYVRDLIRHSSQEFSHRVVLPFEGPFEHVLRAEGIPFSTIGINRQFTFPAILDLVNLLRTNGADILHTHGYRANLHGRIAALLSDTKTITTVHVSLFDYKDTNKFLRFLYFFTERFFSFAASRFICISENMRADMRRLGIPARKLVLIPNGIDTSRFSSFKTAQDGIRMSFAKGAPIVGTVGRMVSEKGQGDLLTAIQILSVKYPDIGCAVVGDGPLNGELRALARSLGIEHRCRFPGVVGDIERVYGQFDVFILPSYREPFGLALIEAMASGVPVVATAAGGPTEIITSGAEGVLVPPHDPEAIAAAVDRLLSDREGAKRMASAGREKVLRSYDVRRTVSAIEAVYRCA